jgi:hypothetical protein
MGSASCHQSPTPICHENMRDAFISIQTRLRLLIIIQMKACRERSLNRRVATPSSYVLGRPLRTTEKYITAKAASNTPPTIKIKVVTIARSHPLDLKS